MTPKPVYLEVVKHEEYAHVELNTLRTAFLHLKTPSGSSFRVQIPHDQLDPTLALIYPDS
jgi:hypothetical protein